MQSDDEGTAGHKVPTGQPIQIAELWERLINVKKKLREYLTHLTT